HGHHVGPRARAPRRQAGAGRRRRRRRVGHGLAAPGHRGRRGLERRRPRARRPRARPGGGPARRGAVAQAPAGHRDGAGKEGAAVTAGVQRPTDPAALRRRATAAVARSAAGERAVAIVLGLVLLVGGTLVALLSYGVFGAGRASRPLLDPMIVAALQAQPLVARFAAIACGLLLTVLGIVWAAHALRPENHPDLVLGPLAAAGDTSV